MLTSPSHTLADLIHWPVPMKGLSLGGNDDKFPKKQDGSRDIDTEWSIAQTWEQMEKVHASGKARAIGISNFSQAFITDLLKTAKVVPACNQVELRKSATSSLVSPCAQS